MQNREYGAACPQRRRLCLGHSVIRRCCLLSKSFGPMVNAYLCRELFGRAFLCVQAHTKVGAWRFLCGVPSLTYCSSCYIMGPITMGRPDSARMLGRRYNKGFRVWQCRIEEQGGGDRKAIAALSNSKEDQQLPRLLCGTQPRSRYLEGWPGQKIAVREGSRQVANNSPSRLMCLGV